jgi:hypothetical protein
VGVFMVCYMVKYGVPSAKCNFYIGVPDQVGYVCGLLTCVGEGGPLLVLCTRADNLILGLIFF